MERVAGARSLPRELADLERAVREKFPDLMLVLEGGRPLFRGSFPVVHEGQVLDRFTIAIAFPNGISRLPAIWEIGGRIPRILDRHVFTNGAICTEVPELTLLRGNYSLVPYLEREVRNYFLGQMLVERGEPWPFGEWDHGKPGLLKAYGEILGVSGEAAIRRHLDCLAHKKIKGHWLCPCGSGQQVRACHFARLSSLHKRIPPRIARQALERLNQYS